MINKIPVRSKSIFSQLLFAFVLIVTIPVLVISLVSVWSSYQIGRQRTIDQLDSIAELKSSEIEMWTNNLDVSLNGLLRKNDLEEFVFPLLQENLPEPEAENAREQFIRNADSLVAETGLFSAISLLDENGIVIVSTDKTLVGSDQSSTVFYQGGLQRNYISPPFYDSGPDNQLRIVLSHPIILTGSGAVGVLVGYCDLTILDQIMEKPNGLGETGESYLVNSDYMPLTILKNQEGKLIDLRKSEGIRSAIETRIHGYGLYRDYAGKPVVGVHYWLPNLQVALMVEQSQKEAFSSSVAMLTVNMIVSFISVLLTILVARRISHGIANPIEELAATASQIAGGDLNRVVSVTRRDEIGKLAETFNHMTAQLRNLIEQLQTELAELEIAEEALRESEDKFRYVFEYSIVGKSITKTTGEIHVNRTFADMLGYEPEELAHKSWQEITHPDDIETTQAFINTILSGERNSWRWEKRFLHKSGAVVWVDISSSLRKDAEGKPLYFITSLIDITERKQAVDEVKKLNADLEKRVSDRTQQLELANKELEAFAYSVSHDLRGPLRAMDGYSNLLISDHSNQLDSEGKRFLNQIHDATKLMSQLIDDMLNLSRISQHEIKQSQLNLSDIACDISKGLLNLYPERRINLQIDPNLNVKGDEHLLRIALENLLNNAFKFTGKREDAEIQFGSKKMGRDVVYFVKDNGTGFDMAYADKLFRPFQRLHTVQEYPGTGIGLVIVQRIIARHGGRIWTEAEIDKGATFFFTLGKK